MKPSREQPWLIVASVAKEARALVDERRWKDRPLERGWRVERFDDHVDVVISGLGRVNAAGAVVQSLTRRRYGLVLNIGVAGALPGCGLTVGDAIVATESVFCEEGIELPGGAQDITGIGFALADPPDAEWMRGNRVIHDRALVAALSERLPGPSHQSVIATVARCSGADEAARRVARETGAVAEAMEGAAVALAARRMGAIPAEIRVISNSCGDRRHQKWDLPAALSKLDVIARALAES